MEKDIVFFNDSLKQRNLCTFQPQSVHGVIYEVVRIIDGVPLFLEDHLNRLFQSAQIAGIMKILPSEQQIADVFNQLINANKKTTGNIQLNIFKNKSEAGIFGGFIKHKYPSAEQYEKGVLVDFLFAERKNPEAKIIQQNLRERSNNMMQEKGLYEVLLVDRHHLVTEGSRSNLFIIADNKLYTAPLQMVLEGITRKKIVSVALDNSIPFIEKPWKYSEILTKAEALFITGTSPKVLPVSTCGDKKFAPRHPVIKTMISEYDKMISDYINAYHR